MWKQTWSLVAIAFCVHCGGATQSPETPAEPAGEEAAKPKAETPTEEAGPTESTENTGGESGGEATSESGGGTKTEPAPAKKKCEELDKSTCKVTVGCAWNDLKKCVEHGGAE